MSVMGKIGSRIAQAGRFMAGWVEDRTGVVSGHCSRPSLTVDELC